MTDALRAAIVLAEEMERIVFASDAPNIVVAMRKRVTMMVRMTLALVELRGEVRRLKDDNNRLRNTVEDLRVALRTKRAA